MQSLSRKRQIETRNVAILFLAPAFFFIFVYIVYGIFEAFHLSLYEWNGIDPEQTYVGLKNWNDLIHDTAFIGAVGHNFIFVVCSIVVQMPVALGLAWILDGWGKKAGFFKVSFYLPSLFATSAVGLIFYFMYNSRNGIFTTISKLFGGKAVDLLGTSSTSLMTVFSVVCWTAIPFYIVFYLAALSGLSCEVFEAARIDGATTGQYFFRIALPSLSNAIKTACTLSMIGSLKYFELVYIMTDGGPNYSSDLMATYMYRMTFRYRQMGYGSTVASAMFLVVTICSLIFLYTINRKADD